MVIRNKFVTYLGVLRLFKMNIQMLQGMTPAYHLTHICIGNNAKKYI